MTRINKIRNVLYIMARVLGDINALVKGKVAKRIARRVTGALLGRMLGKIFR